MTNSIIDVNQELPEVPYVDPEKDYFSELVGEGKTYKTEKDLARAVAEKEAFIERLKREKSELYEDLKSSQTTKRLEEIADQLTAFRQQPQSPSNDDNQPREREASAQTGLTLTDVENLLQKRETIKVQETNRDVVQKRLQEAYGTEFVSKVKDQANKLGVGVEFLDSVAVNNPNVFYKIMGLDNQPQQQPDIFSPPRTRITPVTSGGPVKKNFAYYEKMRKEKPAEYHSINIQNEMHKEALASYDRGEDFYASR